MSTFFIKKIPFYSKNYNLKSKQIKVLPLKVGDPLLVSYRALGRVFSFRGYCISIRSKKMLSKNTCIVLRSVICGVGVQITLFFFSLGSFKYQRDDYRRIQSIKGVKVFRLSKLYFYKYKFKTIR